MGIKKNPIFSNWLIFVEVSRVSWKLQIINQTWHVICTYVIADKKMVLLKGGENKGWIRVLGGIYRR